jgi:hypothetical protein
LKILILKPPSTSKVKKSIFHPLASIFVKWISIAFICIFKNLLKCLFNMWFFIIIVIKSNNMFILISEINDLLKFNTSTEGRTTFHYFGKDHEFIYLILLSCIVICPIFFFHMSALKLPNFKEIILISLYLDHRFLYVTSKFKGFLKKTLFFSL